ncbi:MULTISPECIES: flagellar basal body rod protein FlgC [Bacillus cereus group]|uniref:flagellar basal body rod protein FlgC n=1 Tax=Bacillus cereus group TaxID=86661 RepID=UPI0008641D53|nr:MULTISPECIES: flagellar basal body rod protein FlgC [Bacillus cereus group]AWC28297.1 flagellar basal body rod protein FlgC [Bacillus cytotoxicus]AWC40318.1 flagellar basal body rod protein FlgC [Bacillus cytotoxicus]AWC48249.1 flagellar basal body rod protein FlgC [Bacillus cytotoxicus]AWC52364.1 flagellar basal body rod protein FlgC [Bacillus cytotoxicus]AWC56498.1 flagellar basal body rod protein FlgC [Bacillus cytotoxicus]
MFQAIHASGSGLTAARKWMEVTSNNIVNANTTGAPDGAPYRRRSVVLESDHDFASMLKGTTTSGVKIKSIESDANEKLVYNPAHPHANAEGYVRYPNIDVTAEMTNMIVAQKMYETNASVLNANKKILDKDLEIGRG